MRRRESKYSAIAMPGYLPGEQAQDSIWHGRLPESRSLPLLCIEKTICLASGCLFAEICEIFMDIPVDFYNIYFIMEIYGGFLHIFVVFYIFKGNFCCSLLEHRIHTRESA